MKEKKNWKNGRSRVGYRGDDRIGWLNILLVILVVVIWVTNAAVASQLM